MKKILIIIALLTLSSVTMAETLKDDPRYCGFISRDSRGDIKRSTSVLAKFQRIHPCPSTGLTTGTCPGWSMDHIWSLALGGCDAIVNLQWLPDKIKSCKDDWCKDRFERNIIEIPIETPGFKPSCCPHKLIKFE